MINKKIVSIMTSACLMFSVFNFNVFNGTQKLKFDNVFAVADKTINLKLSDVAGQPGDTVTVDLLMEAPESVAINSIFLMIKSELALDSMISATEHHNKGNESYNRDDGTISIIDTWNEEFSLSEITNGGVYFSFRFIIPESASSETYEVSWITSDTRGITGLDDERYGFFYHLNYENGSIKVLPENPYKYEIIDEDDGTQSVSISGLKNPKKSIIEIPTDIDGIPVTKVGGFSRNEYIEKVVLPDTVKNISPYAFEDCPNLKEIILSNNLESIGEFAFSRCKKLENIDLPDSLNYIGDRAFYDTKEYTEQSEKEAIYIDNWLVHCDNLVENITVNEGTVGIAVYAFGDGAWENYIKTIILPSTIKYINDYAVYCCYNLSTINIPENVSVIGERAFFTCPELNQIIIPKSVTHIGQQSVGYIYYMNYINIEKNENLVISGYKNSEAERYAIENDIAFICIDSNENPPANNKIGDLNYDNKINIVDLCIIKSVITNPDSQVKEKINADINNDGKINVIDALGLIDILFGK